MKEEEEGGRKEGGEYGERGEGGVANKTITK
jgi:hypothetical protein